MNAGRSAGVTRRQTRTPDAAPHGRSAVRKLHVLTYNIHKGFSQFSARMMIHELRRRLHGLNPDIVFLQEVQGLHERHAERRHDWPEGGQHDFIAEGVWPDTAYGGNAIYDHGHHGNAILSRFPILAQHNQDVTHLRFEKRGLLHCAIEGVASSPPATPTTRTPPGRTRRSRWRGRRSPSP